MHCCNDLILFWFLFGRSEPVLVPSLSLVFNLKICLEHCPLFPCWNAIVPLRGTLSPFYLLFQTRLEHHPHPLSASPWALLLPPHVVIKGPLPQTWLLPSFLDRLLLCPNQNLSPGISSGRSSYLFKVCILKRGVRVSSKLVPSIYFPVSMKSMITLVFCHSHPLSHLHPLWVSPYRLYLNSMVISPWQKRHLRYVLFYPNWKLKLWTRLWWSYSSCTHSCSRGLTTTVRMIK